MQNYLEEEKHRQILQEKECVKICEAANLYLQLVVCVVRAH